MLYPFGSKKKLNEFAAFFNVHTIPIFALWQWKKQKYYVYRYEGKTQRYWKCRSSFKLSGKSIWKSKSTACFSQYRRFIIIGRNTVLLCLPVTDRGTFFASVRINWHWTAIRYVLHRESEDTGFLCQWHILCVWQGLVNSVLLKKGYHRIGSIIQTEKYQYLFQLAKGSNDFKAFMKLAG